MKRVALRSCFTLLCVAGLAACEARETPHAGDGTTPGAAAPEDASTSAVSAGGRWVGEVAGGYQGNRISFTRGTGNSVSDVTFEGHWDCADGIETTTSGPEGSFPIQDGSLAITSVDPPDGGATATRFVMTGQVAEAHAEGKLRVNLNALGCDTGELSWSAAPVRK